MSRDFEEVMTEFAAEMEQFEATMREVDDLLAEYETRADTGGAAPGGSPAAGD